MHTSIEKYLSRAENIKILSKKYENLELKDISVPGFEPEIELVLSASYSKATDFIIRDNEDPDKDYDLGYVYVTLFFYDENELIFIESNDKPYLKICRGNVSYGIPKIIHNGDQQLIDESEEDYRNRSHEVNFDLTKIKNLLLSLEVNADLTNTILNELEAFVIENE